MAPTAVERLAGAVLAAEAIALLAVVGWEIVALVGGDTIEVPSSVALIVLTAIGAVALAAFAVSVWRRVSWGRSGGIVAQLLILAVALGAATGQYADAGTAVLIAVPGVVGFVLLVAATRRAARGRGDA
ncbi:histidine kinase [Microbacterium sp. NE2HP2]|uniref:histidine kinase n=1 Tax=Microbacterium plantarum TaxID=1816425 RepID=UPI002365AE80|nr:histidine kinase [Microbacterium plantarum]MDD7945049.1 histidine kinase [Microbacterium plantarum]WRK16603.1 histidine kinase [Microbacterium plantarum]